MNRLAAAVIMFFIMPAGSEAQYYFYNSKYYDNNIIVETGAGFGGMNALTDIGGRKGTGKNFIKDLNMKTTQPSGNVYISATYKSAVALQLGVSFGSIHAYDSILKNVAPTTKRYRRNLSFKSPVTDILLMAEIHPLFIFGKFEENPPRLSPYLLGGAGYFSFNPQARLDDTWYNLHPLRLEGQGFEEYPVRKPYKLQQMNIPVGIGFRYEVSALFNARFEIIHRKLFTDYLDDVSTYYIDPGLFSKYLSSQWTVIATHLYDRRGDLDPQHTHQPGERGDPKDNDSYFTFMIKVGYIFRKRR